MAYYPSYTSSVFPPEKMDFDRYDWVDFAFAVPQEDFSLGWDGSDDASDLLKRLVANAHAKGKKVKVSIGGWTGSKYFSNAVSTPQNRQTFVGNILQLYSQYGIDGIDIDWEYPGQPGNDGNIYMSQDPANYLSFLQLLRETLPPQAKISAATMTVPWTDANGETMKDVSAFAQVLDWILIMNYDTWGSSSNPGPNAPLSNACHNSTQSSSSAVAGVATWTAAGFPANKIVLGVPSYGYISSSSANYLQTRAVPLGHSHARRSSLANKRHVPMHLDGTAGSALGEMGIPDTLLHSSGGNAAKAGAPMVLNEDGNAADGEVQFRDLVQQGVLQYISAWSDTSASAKTDAAEYDRATGDDSGDDTGSSDTDDDSDGSDSSDTGPDDGSSDSSGDTGDQGVLPAGLALPGLTDIDSTTLNALSFAGHQIVNVFNGLKGFVRLWDACSSTPYLRSTAAGQVVSYDDPQSLEMKAVFARYAGLLGVNMFDAHGDTDAGDLVDAVRRGLGL
ncbi:glycoside hydrolase family 18 protein [Phanerochaete carnosa HHB-10118-sp]|uniref:Glycoside hydrolase family 18 protein n=1 Tax=Phanerochaete carnosa (strain HHB-10118-sp) TaxID=650164 RepID=K5WJ30_PHACS|nr:glycoside hydrolase family 18 protein [Phanerochaete carnosa HHB-10118-sp]EKM59129.1 glycoside hydrolase family 18 protein [Phanerochaete carnosa HHB-10118-sp]